MRADIEQLLFSGKDSEEKNGEAFERLAMEETDATQRCNFWIIFFTRYIK